MRLSSTTLNNLPLLQDYGSTYSSGQATHSLALYRHSSGALVFGAGTVQWSWGLDSTMTIRSAAADTRMRQATVNLFADMGVQPATLQPGLAPATQSNRRHCSLPPFSLRCQAQPFRMAFKCLLRAPPPIQAAKFGGLKFRPMAETHGSRRLAGLRHRSTTK